jgi:hypothetical protein
MNYRFIVVAFLVIDGEEDQKEFCVNAETFEQAIDICRKSIMEHYDGRSCEITEWGYSDPTNCDHCGKIICHKLN